MIELKKNIFLIPGENNSRFPYCNGLYVRGKNLRVLIEAGMGQAAVEGCRARGVDLLLLSHCHIDHRLLVPLLPGVPVGAHEKEIPFLEDREIFLEGVGFRRGGISVEGLFPGRAIPFVRVRERLRHGQRLDLGGLTIEVLHTPGHTPGHLSFFIPEAALLFSADIDLTPFGPFYGHDFARIAEFIASIRQLREIKAETVATGHGGVFSEKIPERLSAYEEVIYDRDRRVLKELTRPRALDFFLNRNLFYSHYPEPQALIRWFERVHLEKQLARLTGLGRVGRENGSYRRR
jgi:ribonuclease/clavin/mitogillin